MMLCLPGYAGGRVAQVSQLAYLAPPDPTGGLEGVPMSAAFDFWEPPAPMALRPEVCDEIVAAVRASGDGFTHTPSSNGAYTYLEPADLGELLEPVIERMKAANRLWWDLDIDKFDVAVKQYQPGEYHPLHSDWYPGAGGRDKLSLGVQLSRSEDYTGGAFQFQFNGSDIALPRAQGTVAVFPAWTTHRVTPVIAGERWSLVIFGSGPPLR